MRRIIYKYRKNCLRSDYIVLYKNMNIRRTTEPADESYGKTRPEDKNDAVETSTKIDIANLGVETTKLIESSSNISPRKSKSQGLSLEKITELDMSSVLLEALTAPHADGDDTSYDLCYSDAENEDEEPECSEDQFSDCTDSVFDDRFFDKSHNESSYVNNKTVLELRLDTKCISAEKHFVPEENEEKCKVVIEDDLIDSTYSTYNEDLDNLSNEEKFNNVLSRYSSNDGISNSIDGDDKTELFKNTRKEIDESSNERIANTICDTRTENITLSQRDTNSKNEMGTNFEENSKKYADTSHEHSSTELSNPDIAIPDVKEDSSHIIFEFTAEVDSGEHTNVSKSGDALLPSCIKDFGSKNSSILSPKSPSFVPRSVSNATSNTTNNICNKSAHKDTIYHSDSKNLIHSNSLRYDGNCNSKSSQGRSQFTYTIEPYIPKPVASPSLLPTPKTPRLLLPTPRTATLLPTPPDTTFQPTTLYKPKYPLSSLKISKCSSMTQSNKDMNSHEENSLYKSSNRKMLNKSFLEPDIEHSPKSRKTIFTNERPNFNSKRYPFENFRHPSDNYIRSRSEHRHFRQFPYEGYPPFGMRGGRARGRSYSRLMNNFGRHWPPSRHFDRSYNYLHPQYREMEDYCDYDLYHDQYYSDYDTFDGHHDPYYSDGYESDIYEQNKFEKRDGCFQSQSLYHHHMNNLRSGRKAYSSRPYTNRYSEETWPHHSRFPRGNKINDYSSYRGHQQKRATSKFSETVKQSEEINVLDSNLEVEESYPTCTTKNLDNDTDSSESLLKNTKKISKTQNSADKINPENELTPVSENELLKDDSNVVQKVQFIDNTFQPPSDIQELADTTVVTETSSDPLETNLMFVQFCPPDAMSTQCLSMMASTDQVPLDTYTDTIPSSASYVYTPEEQAQFTNFQSVPFASSLKSGITTTIGIESSNFEAPYPNTNTTGVDFHQEFINGNLDDYENVVEEGLSTVQEGTHIVHFHINPGTTINFTTSDGSEQKVAGETQ